MKIKKVVKQERKTTCNVLIRNYPGEVADQVKALTGEKTLSKALISVSRMYLEIKKRYDELDSQCSEIKERYHALDESVSNYLGALDVLRSISKMGRS